MGQHFYLACHTGFAASWGSGAYASGILGPGFQSAPFSGGQQVVMELRGGAGGGGLDTRGGMLLQPMVGWRADIGRAWGIQMPVGRVKSLRGCLDGPVVEVACVFGSR